MSLTLEIKKKAFETFGCEKWLWSALWHARSIQVIDLRSTLHNTKIYAFDTGNKETGKL